MDVEYLFQVDYAKSGRAGCTKCKTSIAQNSCRIARLVQAPNFDGKIPRWFHFDCFFSKNKNVGSTAEIKNFDSLRWEDQERIRKAICSTSSDYSKFSLKLSLPDMECIKCHQELLKERHMVVDGDTKSGLTYHLSCYLRCDNCIPEISTLTGFKKLKKVDQQAVLLAQDEAKKENKKRSTSNNEGGPPAKKLKSVSEETPDQDALIKQSKILWKLRDNLENEVSKDALIGLLEYNDQHVPSGLSNLLDAVSDAMCFGALTACPSCKKGPLRYTNGQYSCTAMATDWAPCLFVTRDPPRVPFRVPKEYHDVDFLRTYKYKERKRLFATEAGTLGQQRKPLMDYAVFVVSGTHSDGKSKEQVEDEIRALGGTISPKLATRVLVVCGADAWENALEKTKSRAKSLKLRVVTDEVVGSLTGKLGLRAKEVEQILEKHTISPWSVRASPDNKKKHKNVTEDDMLRLKYKGGAVVDPESGLEDGGTVIRDSRGKPMTAVLGMVDLVRGCNSFYRLQALKHTNGGTCFVFRSWGRIGTNIGGSKLDRFPSESDAQRHFEELYLEKTGNEWRKRDKFEKKPNRFYEMELDYSDIEAKRNQLIESQTVASKLDPLVLDLMQFICDLESMTNAMIEFQIDVKKMPLGKLSKRQIQDAYSVLSDLNNQLEQARHSNTTPDSTLILSASTRFYTLIPHDFGMKSPPLLNNTDLIKNKLRMLEDLCEIELAYNILSGDVNSNENSYDQHYRQLNVNLQPMDTNSEEFERIKQYVTLTHGTTHSSYKLEVVAVFDVERPDEKARFDNYTAARHNRQLLWHGSRRTNWVGILSQGLRIAPPEAPVTGYMFGKGIYFADMVSKSANYCYVTRNEPEGLLLLCEVILGNMDECRSAKSSNLPKGTHSRKGLGSTAPDSATYYTNPDGVLYPIGKPKPTNVGCTSLLYNEYIVYNVAQVKQKYLVRVKFLYN